MAVKKSQNGHKKAMKWIAVLLAVFMVVAICIIAFAQTQLGNLGGLDGDATPTKEEESSSVEGEITITDTDQLDWGKAGVATSVNGVCNILLVGQDTRTSGVQGNSDTMIILSINQNTNQLTMVSLMRDLYVQIPGHSQGKLNAAYALGGSELLDQTISENFGIVVDYNVVVDFNGFKDIVDTLGGIDVELTQAEAKYLSGGGVKYTEGRTHDVVAGVNHLDGWAALDYARIRHVGNSDFERTERQRRVIEIVYEMLRKQSLDELMKVYDSIADDISIDMNTDQLLSLATSAYQMGLESINSYRIPVDNMYSDERVAKWGAVLVVNDWDLTRELVKGYLYSEDPEAAQHQVFVEAGLIKEEATEDSLSEEELEAAEQVARSYYSGTVYQVESMEYAETVDGEAKFSVTVSRDGVVQEANRSIALVQEDGSWVVSNEGY
jgi:LCP family protein required for cell wall assembly